MTKLVSCLLAIGIVFCTTPATALFNGDKVKDGQPAPFSEQLEVPTDVGVGNLSNSSETAAKRLLFGADDIGKGFASGTGTEQDPYVIETSSQLRTFARSLNDKFDYTDKFIVLNRDIDISDSNWFPVGGSRFAFNGTFNGCGHTISGLREGEAAGRL